jgi:hypothetical protein
MRQWVCNAVGEAEYLGDGVYIQKDKDIAGAIVLTTGDHNPVRANNTIYFEPEVLEAFLRVIEKWNSTG